MENKAHQAHIKKLQTYLLAAGGQVDKGVGKKTMLEEKENSIQLPKKKLKILATQLIKGLELTEIKKEKEGLKNELTDYKAKLLKFTNKEKKWQKYMTLVVKSEKALKGKYEEIERKL